MEFSKEIKRAIQSAIDYVNKNEISEIDINIYELIDRYKHLREADNDTKSDIYIAIASGLGLEVNGENELIRPAKVFGYARVSTKSQEDNTSLSNQIKQLKENGSTEIYSEVFTGATMDRPKFIALEKKLRKGDTLIVAKLDRFSRSAELGISKVKELAEKGVKINILNMGLVDLSTPMGKMIFTVLSAFAEFEKDTIVERMREGKEQARARAEAEGRKFIEGRPKKFDEEKILKALELLKMYTIKEVSTITGISESTLKRAKRKSLDEARCNKI